jgi:hypothetical protein
VWGGALVLRPAAAADGAAWQHLALAYHLVAVAPGPGPGPGLCTLPRDHSWPGREVERDGRVQVQRVLLNQGLHIPDRRDWRLLADPRSLALAS